MSRGQQRLKTQNTIIKWQLSKRLPFKGSRNFLQWFRKKQILIVIIEIFHFSQAQIHNIIMSKCKKTFPLLTRRQIFLLLHLQLRKKSCWYLHYLIGNITLLAIDFIMMKKPMQFILIFNINLNASSGVFKKFNCYNGVYSLMPCKKNSILKISLNQIGKILQNLFHEKILPLVRVNGCICNTDHRLNFNGI